MNKSKDELWFVPLGGTEEIGMNLNLYGFGPPDDQDWLMVDLGVTFGDDSTPGIEVMMPDPSFIEERVDRLKGLLLTHGHEDHLGAVPYLWQRLQCPVYATPFTAALLRRKLQMDGLSDKVPIEEIPLQARLNIGPFDVELITLTHSMPEPNAVAIRTPLGLVLHTGDWKFDPGPVVGPVADEPALQAIGDEGVLAAVGDSTNVFVPGTSGSEAELLASLTDAIGECKGKVAVGCFASNVARLKTIFEAATANGRAVALVGRSLWRINGAARETGYLTDLPPFLESEEAQHLAPDEVLYICTGSQGEPRAALTRIAAGDHPYVTLGEGDAAIFSSRIIPGNELAIGRLQNRLTARGVRVISEQDHFVHVSGHPARDELIRMYQHLRPRIAVPVHGENRHIRHHAELAAGCQVPETVIAENGSVIRLAPGRAEIVDEVAVGRLAADGSRLVRMDGRVMRERRRTLFSGSVAVTVIVDREGCTVDDPQVTPVGLFDDDEDDDLIHEIAADIRDAVDNAAAERDLDDEDIREITTRAVRRATKASMAKKPLMTVHVVRV